MQEYEWLEYFAGLGNLTKCMKSAMYKSARFDLLDNLHPEHYKSNFMDLNSASGFAPLAHNFNWTLVGFSIALKLSTVDRFVLRRGFWFQRLDSWLLPRHPCQRLAILCMLRTVAADFCAHFGLKCSSFCRVNVGTSYRSACTAIGLHFYKSVASSNKLLERIGVNLTCLGTCMGMINKNHFTSWMRFFCISESAACAGHAFWYCSAQHWGGVGPWSSPMVHISPTIQLGDILWNRSSTLGGQWRSELQHSILHSVFFLFNHITNSTLKDVHVPFFSFWTLYTPPRSKRCGGGWLRTGLTPRNAMCVIATVFKSRS